MSNFLRVQKVLRDQRSAKRNSVARSAPKYLHSFRIPERRPEEVRIPTAAHAALDPDSLEEH